MIRRLLVLMVRAYRYAVSPLLAPSCRFHPSCSEYAIEALERHGAARGGWLAARRVCRCHPWNPGGHDPVPPPTDTVGSAPRPQGLRNPD